MGLGQSQDVKSIQLLDHSGALPRWCSTQDHSRCGPESGLFPDVCAYRLGGFMLSGEKQLQTHT